MRTKTKVLLCGMVGLTLAVYGTACLWRSHTRERAFFSYAKSIGSPVANLNLSRGDWTRSVFLGDLWWLLNDRERAEMVSEIKIKVNVTGYTEYSKAAFIYRYDVWEGAWTHVKVFFEKAPSESPLAEFQGHLVDDVTGEPVTNFWVQMGGANAQKPGVISWSEERYGPVYRKPGMFSLQSIKRGKAWARVVADGYLPKPVTKEPFESPVRVTDLLVRLKRGGELRGIVRDHAGRVVAGARVFLGSGQRLGLTNGRPQVGFGGSAAITYAEGHFALRGVGGTEQKVVVVSADGFQILIAPKAKLGQELKITLPEPATLIVRYDIPDDAPNADFELRRKPEGMEMPAWKDAEFVLKPTVANQGKIVLSNLTPGTYDFARTRMLRVGTESRGFFSDRSNMVLQAGQTQHMDLVRPAGFPIRGKVMGLTDAKAAGAFIFVRPKEVTGDPNKMKDWLLPLFDAVTCEAGGQFSTARIEPGAYSVVAEAFEPKPDLGYTELGWRLPDYIGAAKVTVSAGTAPAPVTIKLTPLQHAK